MINRQPLGAGVFTLPGFLEAAECRALIQASDARGYQPAPIRTEDGERIDEDARSNERILFDDAELAARLFERARPWLPPHEGRSQLSGFNERWRYYRYQPGQSFAWHWDGSYQRSSSECSALTFLIYLNDAFEGGHTQFAWESVAPQAGMALVFPHLLRHQGAAVVSGIKYVLRTDVMYRSDPEAE